MLKLLMLTGPSTLVVPVSRLPVLAPLSSATLTVSSASVKSSLTGVTVMDSVELSSVPEPSVTT